MIVIEMIVTAVGLVFALTGSWTLAVVLPLLAGGTAPYVARGRAAHRQALVRSLQLIYVDARSGAQFKLFVADLMRRSDYRRVTVVGKAGDDGVDVLAIAPDGQPTAVQCKRYQGEVGSPEARSLIGAVAHEHAGRMPMIVTYRTLTARAWKLAQTAGVFVVQRDGLGQRMAATREGLAA